MRLPLSLQRDREAADRDDSAYVPSHRVRRAAQTPISTYPSPKSQAGNTHQAFPLPTPTPVMPEHDSPMGTSRSPSTTPSRPRMGEIAVLFADRTESQHWSAPVVQVPEPGPPAGAEGAAGGEEAEVVPGAVDEAGAEVVGGAAGVETDSDVVAGVEEDVAGGVEGEEGVAGAEEVAGALDEDAGEEGAEEEEGADGADVDGLLGAAMVATARTASIVKREAAWG